MQATVVSFTHRGGLRDADRFYFVALLTVARCAVLLSFTPFLFAYAGVARPALWIGSSSAMLFL